MDNQDSLWIKLKLNFFAHPKVRFILKKHSAFGPLCVLAIWSQMMDRSGLFDANNEFDLEGISDSCACSVDDVKSIIDTALKCNLLSTTSTPGVYTKDRIKENLQLRTTNVARASNAGRESAKKRQNQSISNSELTPSTHQVNSESTKKKERKKEIEEGNNSVGELLPSEHEHSVVKPTPTTPAALWPRLVEIFKIPDPGPMDNYQCQRYCEAIMGSDRKDRIVGLFKNLKEGKETNYGQQIPNANLIASIQRDPVGFLYRIQKHKFKDETNPTGYLAGQ